MADKLEHYLNKYHKEISHTYDSQIFLFHAAKSRINDSISFSKSREIDDFGHGLYTFDNLIHTILFIHNFPKSVIYIYQLNLDNLAHLTYKHDIELIMTLAYYRGLLNNYAHLDSIQHIISKIQNTDYIIAPVVNNRSFEMIELFISGEITDKQCINSLAHEADATELVIKSEKALSRLIPIDFIQITDINTEFYANLQRTINQKQLDKIKQAQIQYRGKGKYIDEIFK